MILTHRPAPNLQTLTGDLIALLEREKRRGRDYLRLGPAGRQTLAVLTASVAAGRPGTPARMRSTAGPPRIEAGPALEQLHEKIRNCRSCPLGGGRRQAVPGEGPATADVMVVGEGPGEEEDRLGQPFVGPAGELLTRMLLAIDLPREKVFIGNVVKCRPPGNRNPEAGEIRACFPFLQEQVRLIKPRLLVALGGVAARALTGSERGISEIRGKSFSWEGRLVIPTYHPAYLLRSPEYKREAWEDLKKIRRELERLIANDL
ncbi:MAG: uracil-DNA glycosylase [Desulfobacterota bacterium]|nr:uracil-DNA glycosylase [Thermodesulfobacteriota bacterium]